MRDLKIWYLTELLREKLLGNEYLNEKVFVKKVIFEKIKAESEDIWLEECEKMSLDDVFQELKKFC